VKRGYYAYPMPSLHLKVSGCGSSKLGVAGRKEALKLVAKLLGILVYVDGAVWANYYEIHRARGSRVGSSSALTKMTRSP